MPKRFFVFLSGDVPARLPSDFSLSASVERLRARTRRSVLFSLHRRAAVGQVTPSTARLQRVSPFFGNSFKPIFVGAFHERDGRVTLEGPKIVKRPSRVFTIAWLAFALPWTALAAFAALKAAEALSRQSRSAIEPTR